MLERRRLEGLDELRASLLINLDSEVLGQIECGDWLLLKSQAEFGQWPVAASVFDQTVLEMMNNPPAQPVRTPRIFRLVDSITGEPLAQQPYLVTVDGVVSQRVNDLPPPIGEPSTQFVRTLRKSEIEIDAAFGEEAIRLGGEKRQVVDALEHHDGELGLRACINRHS